MDIKKLQRAIVDGLEDLKGQNIAVFDTEHLSSLFERVVIASGTSNRQTRALASSVREAVKEKGFPVPRVEGEENGEWIIVDCGAAVVHLMQQTIRDYYNLEEIWGDKPVKLNAEASGAKLVKASEPADDGKPAAKKAAAKKAAPKKASEPASGHKAAALAGPTKKSAAKKAPAKKAAVKKAPVQKVSKTEVLEKPKSAVKKPAAKKGVVSRTVGVKSAAPAKKASVKAPAAKKAAPARSAAKSAAKPAAKKAVAKKAVAKKATRSA